MPIAFAEPFDRLQRELDRLLEGAFGPLGRGPAGVYPPVNVFDAGEAYVLKAELPGVLPEQIDVNVEDETVVLSGERAFTDPNREVAFHRREREQGRFRRVVRMPGRLAADEAKAGFRDGVLTIRIPKARESRPRRVEIQGG